jgi:hypothetical protein
VPAGPSSSQSSTPTGLSPTGLVTVPASTIVQTVYVPSTIFSTLTGFLNGAPTTVIVTATQIGLETQTVTLPARTGKYSLSLRGKPKLTSSPAETFSADSESQPSATVVNPPAVLSTVTQTDLFTTTAPGDTTTGMFASGPAHDRPLTTLSSAETAVETITFFNLPGGPVIGVASPTDTITSIMIGPGATVTYTAPQDTATASVTMTSESHHLPPGRRSDSSLTARHSGVIRDDPRVDSRPDNLCSQHDPRDFDNRHQWCTHYRRRHPDADRASDPDCDSASEDW